MTSRLLSQRLLLQLGDVGAFQPGGLLQKKLLQIIILQLMPRIFLGKISRKRLEKLHLRLHSPLSRTMALQILSLFGVLPGSVRRMMRSPWNIYGRIFLTTLIVEFAFMQNALVPSTGAAP